jgi:two-component system response regulator BaeR
VNQQHVFIVEDEPKIAQILVDNLSLANFKTSVLHDGGQALESILNQQPDFVILDVMLPNKDGLQICKALREVSQVPILMLTAKIEEIDRLMGLGFGADDYVCKPFSAREVVARVEGILRRTSMHHNTTIPNVIAYKNIALNIENFSCVRDGHSIELTPVEFRLLGAMLQHPGKVFDRTMLMTKCYTDDRIVSHRTVDSHMKNLRAKLNLNDQESCLHSVYGIGYKVE